jgi:hypothetical protein
MIICGLLFFSKTFYKRQNKKSHKEQRLCVIKYLNNHFPKDISNIIVEYDGTYEEITLTIFSVYTMDRIRPHNMLHYSS